MTRMRHLGSREPSIDAETQSEIAELMRCRAPGQFGAMFAEQCRRDGVSNDDMLLREVGAALESAFFENGKRRTRASACRLLNRSGRTLVRRYRGAQIPRDAAYFLDFFFGLEVRMRRDDWEAPDRRGARAFGYIVGAADWCQVNEIPIYPALVVEIAYQASRYNKESYSRTDVENAHATFTRYSTIEDYQPGSAP